MFYGGFWKGFGTVAMALLYVFFTACTTVPEVGRSQFNLISPSMERSMGRDAFTRMKAATPFSNDTNATAMLQRVGRRIAAVADLPKAKWEFVLFNQNKANAFCLPGGKVGVYSGILPITQNEEGLATVLAHEVAHAVAHHGSERISRVLAIQGLGIAVLSQMNNLNSSTRNLLYTAYGIGTTLGSELPHSRLQESEADEIGLIYMARAGYDPEQAIAFWQRFSDYNQKKGSKVPWFLRTHPLDEQRIENLRRLMPKAKLQYRPRLGDVNAPVVAFKKILPARLKAVMLVDPVNGAAKTISWVPSLTLYSARRKAGFNRVPNVATIERGSKVIPGKRDTALEPGDIVRWK
ncbi:MAG: M48 family metallopeptidase [Verrucomicrobiota bacterium]|jgi:predicted Zn-dependent protease|nr:M48 family metallopeptidase [Verrucomicrobiota bacterium]